MLKKLKSKTLAIIIAISFVFSVAVIASLFYIFNPITSIYIKQLPNKISYYESEEFDGEGMLVYAKYKYFGVEKEITDYSVVVDSPILSSTKKVEIVYDLGDIEKTTTFDISVQPRVIDNIVVLNYPSKTDYYEGEYFDLNGLKLQVNCKGKALSFEPKNIIIDKQNTPLSVNDSEITISYTENNKTVSTKIGITVKKNTQQNQQIIEINELINLLPNDNEVGLDDEGAIIYVQNLIAKLSEEQRNQIDTAKVDKLCQKIEQLKKEQEIALNTEYNINYQLKDLEAEIDFNNLTTYKNADGIIELNQPISNKLYNLGYDFSHWEDDAGNIVSSVQNISGDMTFYAVYEMSSKINIRFFNNNNEEIGVIAVNRFNGTDFYYNLKNNEINNFIFEKTGEVVKYFSINGIEVSGIETKLNREVAIKVLTQSPQDIVEDNIETPQNNSVMFVMGDNVTEFVLNDGYLTEDALSDIYVIFNEQNNNYINYYVISGIVKIYDDLSNINFGAEKSNIVVVTKNENVFNVTLTYTGGQKTFYNLVGRQKIIDALKQYANNDVATLYFVNELSKKFDFEQILYKNVEFNLPERTNFEISLHIDDEIYTLNVPDSSQNYKLTDNLPNPKKLGYIFTGWANEINGQIVSNEFLNIILQNNNEDLDLYAVWEVDPNYKKPETQVNYSQNFVGDWNATLEHNGVILKVELKLESDGIYSYKIYNNDIETVNVFGDYRFENNQIVIYFVETYGDYEYIQKDELSFDVSFVDSNLLIATCFYVSKTATSASIECFDVVLNKGNVKPENYYGNAILGTYKIEIFNILTNTFESFILELANNGGAVITCNGVTQNAYYRILNDKVMLLSNGFIGIQDITEYIVESNRV